MPSILSKSIVIVSVGKTKKNLDGPAIIKKILMTKVANLILAAPCLMNYQALLLFYSNDLIDIKRRNSAQCEHKSISHAYIPTT